ncbi:unnamed protein product [Pieris macdunnoughi]|uniref:Uncharacterized protein n=1 Tax=Pieris macdunnoughi TaxID=345717 RepID=A0A821VEL1_9NEOP|nr:unnamed protein product [Pieris macdunnoughi]
MGRSLVLDATYGDTIAHFHIQLSFLWKRLLKEGSWRLVHSNIPSYIKRALNEKNRYKMAPKATRHITNLTLPEVVEKIKKITLSLNQHAKKNGYFVDYNFRIIDKD